jgi:hypothetical protein
LNNNCDIKGKKTSGKNKFFAIYQSTKIVFTTVLIPASGYGFGSRRVQNGKKEFHI